jgi:hypothetical protein
MKITFKVSSLHMHIFVHLLNNIAFPFQFPAHAEDQRTATMWRDNDEVILQAYYGYKGLAICPTCGLIVADIAELQREHRNAGAFSVTKKQLFKQCKFYFFLYNIAILLMILASFSIQRCQKVYQYGMAEDAHEQADGGQIPAASTC